jgi:hypothetical protein
MDQYVLCHIGLLPNQKYNRYENEKNEFASLYAPANFK